MILQLYSFSSLAISITFLKCNIFTLLPFPSLSYSSPLHCRLLILLAGAPIPLLLWVILVTWVHYFAPLLLAFRLCRMLSKETSGHNTNQHRYYHIHFIVKKVKIQENQDSTYFRSRWASRSPESNSLSLQ